MATWVTHLMIADKLLEQFPLLDRRGFCVGSIAPDCNVENEDWTEFDPPREVTHWMQGNRKTAADCEAFYQKYLVNRADEIKTEEHRSFLLGYYAHLTADAEFQRFIRDEERIRAVWLRIHGCPALHEKAAGQPETWDTVKKLVSRTERMQEISALEAEYLAEHPDSGYMTEILPLEEFPDYLDYMPGRYIVRKIDVMGDMPQKEALSNGMISITRAEYEAFVTAAVQLLREAFTRKRIG